MRHPNKFDRKSCKSCNSRPALFLYGGRFAWRADHELCRQCLHSMFDRLRVARFHCAA